MQQQLWRSSRSTQRQKAFWSDPKSRVSSTVPERPPSTLMLSPSSPRSLSFCFLLLFTGSGGACSPPNWSCRLARPGFGFIVGGLFNLSPALNSAVPLLGFSPDSFGTCSCVLNLFTILLTFPSERLVLLPLSPGGGELGCVDGFGGISGLGLASGLTSTGDEARWGASWTDMVTGVFSNGVFHSQPWPIRGQALRAKVNVSVSSSPDE